MLAPSDCPQGFQVQALPYGRVKQPAHPIHPLLTGGRHKRLGHCSTHSWGSHSALLLLLLFFLLVMLPSAIPKLPMDRPVRGFPTVWKLLLLDDSLPRMGLHPSLLSLFLSFIVCANFFQREWAAFLGGWCLLPVFWSHFVEDAQHSNDLLMNYGVRKRSPCPIPPPSWGRPLLSFLYGPNLQFSCSVMSDSLWPHGLQHARPPCPPTTPRAYPNSWSFESVMPSNHLIFYRPLLLSPSIFPTIRVFSNSHIHT